MNTGSSLSSQKQGEAQFTRLAVILWAIPIEKGLSSGDPRGFPPLFLIYG